MENAEFFLKKYWGFESFRPPQDQIIASVLQSKDTIALLPTGGGKSLCYQLPALIMDGKTLVISPLIALMQDQVDALLSKGIKAKALNATLHAREIDIILDNFVYGDLQILYISPERISSEIFITRFAKANVSLIAVDEAHCISQWGYDFRPSYFNIIKLREIHKTTPFIALTATATPTVLADIQNKLELKSPLIFKKSFIRENLSFIVINTEDKTNDLLHILQRVKGCAVIYVRNRKETILIGEWLIAHNITSTSYHGGMDKTTRDKNQAFWMQNKVRVMVATNAFGMGIDKADVRLVVHLDVASSLEEYYQEAGRAGRDGQSAIAVCIFNQSDIARAEKNLFDQFPSFDTIKETYDKLCRYFKVAFGSGQNENFDFDFSDFSTYCGITPKKLYHILNIIEKDGWIYLSDGFKEPTRVMIICHHEDLNFTDIFAHEKSRLITHLLRKYEGLFVDFIKIDEDRIAKELDWESNQIDKILLILQSEGILNIKPKISTPQITFLLERPEKNSFSIDTKTYNMRRKMAEQRLSSMMHYMEQEIECRQKIILEYFGEKGQQCGKCDVCRGAMQEELSYEQNKMVYDHLLKVLNNKNISIKAYTSLYPYNKRRQILKAIKLFESEKKIFIDNSGVIFVRKDV